MIFSGFHGGLVGLMVFFSGFYSFSSGFLMFFFFLAEEGGRREGITGSVR